MNKGKLTRVVNKLARLSILPFRTLGYRAFVIEPKQRTGRRFPRLPA